MSRIWRRWKSFRKCTKEVRHASKITVPCWDRTFWDQPYCSWQLGTSYSVQNRTISEKKSSENHLWEKELRMDFLVPLRNRMHLWHPTATTVRTFSLANVSLRSLWTLTPQCLWADVDVYKFLCVCASLHFFHLGDAYPGSHHVRANVHTYTDTHTDTRTRVHTHKCSVCIHIRPRQTHVHAKFVYVVSRIQNFQVSSHTNKCTHFHFGTKNQLRAAKFSSYSTAHFCRTHSRHRRMLRV